MPKSHFPVHGGPHPASWSANTVASVSPEGGTKAETPLEDCSRQELEAEVRRLRAELARVQRQESSSVLHPEGASMRVVWAALAVFAACLLFTLTAFLRR